MRHIRFRIIPEDGAFHPIDRLLAQAESVRRRAIHRMTPVGSDEAVTVYELEGNPEENQDLLHEIRRHRDMVELEVKPVGSAIYAYAHFQVNETVAHLGLIMLNSEILIEFPLQYAQDGSLRVYAVATHESIREFQSQLPENLSLAVETIGEHHPQGGRFWTQLTERQQEILRAAVETGYYDSPRRATYEEIGERLGISNGTVGEHLQKIEKCVLNSIVPDE
jgi:predicted DNA binding protein